MPLRSLLFTPGDSEKKLAKALALPADALIVDLEDSVALARKAAAREQTQEFLRAQSAQQRARIWVRVNPLDTPFALADLAAVISVGPRGIVLPKAAGPGEVARLGHYLDVLEARDGIAPGSTSILPITTETAAAVFTLGEYARASLPRLIGLTWGAEDLSAALGASGNREDSGAFAFTYRMVRSHCLLAAKAAGVEAIDTLHADFRDAPGLDASCRAARQEGFTGKLAIHPDQVEVINAAFLPSAQEVAFARRVVAAFAAEPQAGVVSLDGKMLDLPHLIGARQVLAHFSEC